MAKTIFIHVGAGKTGTTAIQAFFKLNRSRLQQQGIAIPSVGMINVDKGIAPHKLSDHGPHQKGEALGLWGQISNLTDSCLLVSSESLHSKISAPDGLVFFESVKKILSEWSIKIIFYIRPHSQWLQSAYEQWVKSNLLTRTIDEQISVYRNNPSEQIFMFGKIFGVNNVIVRPYEKNQFVGENIFSDFANAIGISIGEDYEFPKGNLNSRLSAEALELKRELNLFASNQKELQSLKKDLLEYSSITAKEQTTSTFHKHSIISTDQQRKIENENEENYRRIAKEFLGRKNGKLFFEKIKEEDSISTVEKNEDNINKVNSSKVTVFVFLLYKLYLQLDVLKRRNDELEEELEKLKNPFQ